MNSFRDRLKRIQRFVAHEVWLARPAGEPRWRRMLLRQSQLWILVAREFIADRCLLHATALAFTTLLSLVPLLALMFAMLKSFDVQNHLQPLLLEYLAAGSESVALAIITYINNTSVAQLGTIGLIALILSVLSLLSRVEDAFNAIWGVKETRSIQQRFTGYFSVVTIGPVFVVAAISMSGSLQSQIFVQWLLDVSVIGDLLIVLFNVLPFLVMWLVFAGLYLFIPNTRVFPQAALIGGIFSGTLWQLSQWAYVDFQVGVARYNKIYGTLAALPIFMVWLFLSWAVVLLGLEVTYAVQNLKSVRRDLRGGRVSITGRTRVVLAVMVHLARRFQRGEPAPCIEILAVELEIPPRLLGGILDLLQRQGLVVALAGAGGVSGFVPAREPDTMLLADLLGSIAGDGADYLPPIESVERAAVVGLVERLALSAGKSLAGMTLRDMVEQAEAGEKRVQSAGG